jgi:hypothetical protein
MKKLAHEAEQQRRRETPGTWEHYFAKYEEANRHARDADLGVRPLRHGQRHNHRQVIFLRHFFWNLTIHCNSCLKSLTNAWPDCIRSHRVMNRSITVVMYVRWRCRVTTRLCDSGSGCVTISLMILNQVIQRYEITDCVVKSHLKYLMSFKKC